jgi:hypothetical protein
VTPPGETAPPVSPWGGFECPGALPAPPVVGKAPESAVARSAAQSHLLLSETLSHLLL